MPALSLRTRLLAGLTAVAVVLIAVAWAITATTRSHLIDQVDDQLIAASDPERDIGLRDRGDGVERPRSARDGRSGLPERFGTMFEGVIHQDRDLEIIFQPNLPGQNFSPPALRWEAVVDRTGMPFTADAVDGDVNYRVLALTTTSDGIIIRALPLDNVDEAVNRLIMFETIGLTAVLLVLTAVAWWVIRLGIRPIEAMTETATEITDDDLTVRVPEPAAAGTEAGALARALNMMLGRIETAVDEQNRSEERLRRFVADASHELRTPVTTIRGYAELYRRGGLHDSGELDDAMRRTEQEAKRMGRLVEDMLTLAKLDQERPLDRTDVDLSRLVNDIVADASINAPDHVIGGGVEPSLTVAGDEDRLRQVLANIIGNATIHTPAGTTVAIDAHRNGDTTVVEITDDGPGMEREDLARATERFYRADPSRSRERGGSGLGLSIADNAMHAHGGTLTISSEPGQGTTVVLHLPTPPARA